jgi:putative ATP-dependent endonuclease of OLD family
LPTGDGLRAVTTFDDPYQVMIDDGSNARMHIVRRDSGETNFALVEDDTFSVIDEIGARNSDLLQSDFVLYVEGPSDVKVVNEIGRHAIDDWKKSNIVIQHLGGSNLAHCEPEKLERINRHFALLLDSDQKSEDGQPKEKTIKIQELFEEHEIRCDILERREIENYYSYSSINEVCRISIDEDFIGPYDDVEDEIGDEMDDGYGFDKLVKGPKIVRNMYESGECIDPVESLLRDCVEETR